MSIATKCICFKSPSGICTGIKGCAYENFSFNSIELMQYNKCKTCGANNRRAGLLINDECLNCHDTRKNNELVIHTNLIRTKEELQKTIAILK